MKYDEYEEPITGSHKRRLAKVTLYLEVPAVNPETSTWYTEDELCKCIEDNLLVTKWLREVDGIQFQKMFEL